MDNLTVSEWSFGGTTETPYYLHFKNREDILINGSDFNKWLRNNYNPDFHPEYFSPEILGASQEYSNELIEEFTDILQEYVNNVL